MPLVYDNTRTAKQGGGWIERPDAQAFVNTELPGLRDAAADRLRRSQNRWKTADKVAWGATTIPLMAGLSSIFSAGTGAAAGASGGGIVGPLAASGPYGALGPAGGWTAGAGGATGGALSRLGSIFNSKGMELGVNAGLNLLGMRSQNKANDQARTDALNAQREALTLQRQQLEIEARNADLDREDARRLNEAVNELKRRELAITEEQRTFDRGLLEARETRLAPYRQVNQQALQRLSSLWNLG